MNHVMTLDAIRHRLRIRQRTMSLCHRDQNINMAETNRLFNRIQRNESYNQPMSSLFHYLFHS